MVLCCSSLIHKLWFTNPKQAQIVMNSSLSSGLCPSLLSTFSCGAQNWTRYSQVRSNQSRIKWCHPKTVHVYKHGRRTRHYPVVTAQQKFLEFSLQQQWTCGFSLNSCGGGVPQLWGAAKKSFPWNSLASSETDSGRKASSIGLSAQTGWSGEDSLWGTKLCGGLKIHANNHEIRLHVKQKPV